MQKLDYKTELAAGRITPTNKTMKDTFKKYACKDQRNKSCPEDSRYAKAYYIPKKW